MPESQKQLVERIKQAQNVLVTVSKNPSVDQLAAAIGLTLALNHLGKHATAVFSGEVPSTLEFLKPEETLEKNTDSLRDFIIALDKSKADKLRYKVEDNVVRIFITPYRTSISDKDLQFSQGDFNVEVVLALGVGNQQDLDEAITQHGRILHDATVASIGTHAGSELGSINWFEEQSSSLSEMVISLIDALDKKAMDNQMATALLTGIVAATERFRNEKTTPKTMSASAELMAAGANQQLVATQLETPAEPPVSEPSPEGGQSGDGSQPPEEVNNDPGMLAIDHKSDPSDQPPSAKEESKSEEEEPESPIDTTLAPEPEAFEEPSGPQVHVDEDGRLSTEPAAESGLPHIGPVHGTASEGISEPNLEAELPEMNFEDPERTEQVGLTANTVPEPLDPSTETLAQPNSDTPVLTHDQPAAATDSNTPATLPTEIVEPTVPSPAFSPAPFSPPPAPAPVVVSNDQPVSSDLAGMSAAPLAADPLAQPPLPVVTSDETLDEIEAAVGSKYHDMESPDAGSDVDSARDAVQAALNGAGGQGVALEPITALNAQPFGTVDHAVQAATPAQPPLPNAGFNEPTPGTSPADDTLDMPLPSFGGAAPAANPLIPMPSAPQSAASDSGTTPPPPVPPPPILPPLQ